MAVAELFIGAFISVLFEKLGSADLIRLAQSAGIYSELNKWKDTLSLIQAVLVDAGHKHIRERSVEIWLNKLQHLAYEIDDVVDDLATEAALRRLNQESSKTTSKVLKFIPNKFSDLKYGRKMSSKLDGITIKLQDLIKEKNLLGLNANVESSNRDRRQAEETSLIHESKIIIGREDDKNALLRTLLDGESSSSQTQNFKVVSIVGLGGIGKTTLAQLLYNDKKVKDHFKLMAWVCVSDEFSVFNISKSILQAIGGNQDFADLNLLQVALTEKLSNKKFLLVLDDVWNEKYNEWELLERPFYAGCPGSKVLVTTRKNNVALVMDCVQTYHLDLLSHDDALSLFTQHASCGQTFDVHQVLQLHGEDIVKKCGRLPLALRTLGRVFRSKSTYDEWEELLNNEIWNLDIRSKILPALRLSYYDLPPHLKQIFAYCCLFPKDYKFQKDELVLLWMGEGFLDHLNGDKPMEIVGGEYFKELVSRSFFQQYSIEYMSQYIMHDLISDLATSVGREFFFLLDEKTDVYTMHGTLEKVHHLSFIHEEYEAHKKFKALQRARHLRTVLGVSDTRPCGVSFASNKVLMELPRQLKFLRVLSLSHYKINEVPQSIGGLKHLRYLNLSHTNITCLPKQVGQLHNLQSLLLSCCSHLSSLPNSITKLINLRHLDIAQTSKLNKMPLGLGELTSLQTLSRVIIGGASECRISDLKDLVHLRGQLSIEGLHEVKDAVHAKEVHLNQKKGINDLHMKWCDNQFDDSRNETTEYEVLIGLRPFEKLSKLVIQSYNGTKFPSWVGDPSFDCLTRLMLLGCKNCTSLPTLGQLPSLKKLIIKSMYGLKSLGSEFLKPYNSCHGTVAFPSLEFLMFSDMVGWEEWSTTSGDDADQAFPCVSIIRMINCPNLNSVAIRSIPSLQELCVEGCCATVLESMVGVSSSIATLILVNIKGLTNLHGEVLEHLKEVETLRISNCNEITYLWESEAVACEILVNLRWLVVRECASLVSIGEKYVNMETSIGSVRRVEIYACPRLESYNCPNSIERLTINDSCSLTSLAFPTTDNLPSTLESISISGCDNMEVSWLRNNFLSSLEGFSILNIPTLRLFPKGCLAYLTTLKIQYCDNIESIPDNGYGFLPCLCLRYLTVSKCKNLKSFPHEHLQSLASLKSMNIIDCPSMDHSFPSGLWPPNLTSLSIGGLKKPISQWGMQNFPTSLVELELYGKNSRVISFAKAKEDTSSSSFLLPSTLTNLSIWGFTELESLSEGLHHLTCLRELNISKCPKLKDLPETLLPSLLSLVVFHPHLELKKKCSSKNGKYWPIISQIPYHLMR